VAAPSRLLQRWGLALWALAAANLVLSSQQAPSSQAGDPVPQRGQDSSSCIECHAGIEAMHPKAELSCVDCHGGDGSARSKFSAHIVPRGNPPSDERVAGLKADLAYRRFKNPMDLRVASATCGSCHKRQVDHLAFSLAPGRPSSVQFARYHRRSPIRRFLRGGFARAAAFGVLHLPG